jgi:hypothetical protein
MGGAILPLPQMYSWRAHGQLYLYSPYRHHGSYKLTTPERALGIKKKHRRPAIIRRCTREVGPESPTECRRKSFVPYNMGGKLPYLLPRSDYAY